MSRAARLAWWLAASGACLGRPLPAQQARLHWLGEAPRQGAFAWLLVEAGSAGDVRAVRGTLDGAPLFFEALADGAFAALAGVPLDARDSIPAHVTVERASGAAERVVIRLPVVAARFPSERLSVPPEYTRPPDSALAARIEREMRQGRLVSERALGTPRLWRGAFVPPRDAPVTSGYGRARVFNGEVRSRHLGTDFNGVVGDPVVATNRGVVALIGDFYYAGRIVYVDHGAGLVSAYMHLSEVEVAVGDTVTAGRLIGRVGRSGRVTGPHLHWTVKYGAAPLDGTTLLALPPLDTIAASSR